VELTDSAVGGRVLDDFDRMIERFRKVMPTDYRRVLDALDGTDSERADGVDETITVLQG